MRNGMTERRNKADREVAEATKGREDGSEKLTKTSDRKVRKGKERKGNQRKGKESGREKRGKGKKKG